MRFRLQAIGMILSAIPILSRAQDPATQTLHVGTQLVVLDATVFDKSGHLVTQPLTKEDFQIQEDKRPQTIRTFEAPSERTAAAGANPTTDRPRTIFVLDELNSRYLSAIGDKANLTNLLSQQVYLRKQLIVFLRRQPAMLPDETEILALTHHGFQELAPFTRDRERLISVVSARDPGLGSPWRDFIEETGAGGIPDGTLTKGSMSALWSLALAQRSQPGRKDVIWLGWGGPDHGDGSTPDPKHLTSFERYVRQITDLLVEARITLNLAGPGLGPGSELRDAAVPGQVQAQGSFSFESNFGFSGYIAATGGRVQNGNDVSGEIETVQTYDHNYYTLGYRPDQNDFDGRFRRIRVSIAGHPDWTVLTKAGYYALQFGGEKDLDHELQSDLSIAAFEAMGFHAIGVSLVGIERVRGGDTVRFTVNLHSDDLVWQTDESGKRIASVGVAAAALGSVFTNHPLNSQVGTWKLTAPPPEGDAAIDSTVTVIGHLPLKTQRMRIIVRDMANGRMGTLDIAPATIVKAPVVDFLPPQPALRPRLPPQ